MNFGYEIGLNLDVEIKFGGKMNMENLVNKIVEKNLKLAFENEDFTTRKSVENAKQFKKDYGKPDSLVLKYDKTGNENFVELQAIWNAKGYYNELKWSFKGLNVGYMGEGPRGLLEVCEIFECSDKLPEEKLLSLKDKKGEIKLI